LAIDRIASGGIRRHLETVAKLAAVLIATIPLLLSMALVFLTEASAFSNRGRIWALGREAVGDHAFTGVGIDRWSLLSELGYFGRGFDRFTHSEFLLIYFAGGVVGLVLFALILYRVTYRAIIENGSLARGAVYPLAFAVCGVIETIWNPLTIDAGTWFFFALISVASAASAGDTPQHNETTRTRHSHRTPTLSQPRL